MHKKHRISEDTKRHRATWRCAHCGRFIEYDEGFADREDRGDDCSSVLMFCNEAHADAFHGGKPVLDEMECRILRRVRSGHFATTAA